ncbi:uncharacterized protein LOC144446656 [Glandiceps talaboti]
MKSMCRDDLLRRQVLSTFPPISVTTDSRSRQNERGSTDSVSLYSKNKLSNVWSRNLQSNALSNKSFMRKRLTQRAETERPATTFTRTTREAKTGLPRERTTVDLKDLHGGEKDYHSCKFTSRSNSTTTPLTQRNERDGTDKRRRESSSTNSSSLPKMAQKKKPTLTTAEESRPSVQREMTVIIKYDEDDEYTFAKQTSKENKLSLSFRPTLETALEGDEDTCDSVGYLQPAKSRSILEWLDSCEKAKNEPLAESVKQSEEHLPFISDTGNA